MNIKELHEFIRLSRIEQGVSWYLVDSSPLTRRGILYTLYVFEDGELVAEIKNVEERERRQIPASVLKLIADSRKLAGVDPAYARSGEPNWRSAFRNFRRIWIESGHREFLQTHNCTA